MRGDQLDRIGFRRFSLADLIEIAAKSQGKVGQRLLSRFGGCRCTEQFLQVVRRIAEFFARQSPKPLAQLRHSHDLAHGAKKWLMGQNFANLPQQIQPVRNDSAPIDFSLDLKLVAIGLSKSRQLVVGDSEHFPQHSHDFVARIRIDHDREQRRKPRVRRMLGLTITFGLDFDRNLLLEQRIADCP